MSAVCIFSAASVRFIRCDSTNVTDSFGSKFSLLVANDIKLNRFTFLRARLPLREIGNVAENLSVAVFYLNKAVAFFIVPLDDFSFHTVPLVLFVEAAVGFRRKPCCLFQAV